MVLDFFIFFMCCYVGGMLTLTKLEKGDTSFIRAVYHFFIGWSIGLLIAILITEWILPLVRIG